MTDHFLTWFETLIRWFHVIAGVAWIGASFYFNWQQHRVVPRRGGLLPFDEQRGRLDRGDRRDIAVREEHLGHAQLLAQNTRAVRHI